MYIAGIIAEYNPFHNGHLYHLQKTKELTSPDLIIVVMSGSFVQRGEPAIVNKWSRAKMALEAGADLVLELPTIYSCSSASGFAYGSILTLKEALANCFVCGTENDELTTLQKIANISINESQFYKRLLQEGLDRGLSYAKAHAQAVTDILPETSEIITGSNNILTINYLKAVKILNSKIEPILVKRVGSAYNSTELKNTFASATAIRKVLPNLELIKPYMPQFSYKILKNTLNEEQNPITINDYSQLILGLLRRSEKHDLLGYPEMEIGMPELFINNSRKHNNLNNFISSCTSKRYQSSRIKRMLLRIMLKINNELYDDALTTNKAPYLRVLGMRKNKSTIIKKWRSQLACTVIQRPAHYKPNQALSKQLWELDLRATDLYTLLLNNKLSSNRQDMSYPFIVH